LVLTNVFHNCIKFVFCQLVKSNIIAAVASAITLNGLVVVVTHRKFHQASKSFVIIKDDELSVSYNNVIVIASLLSFLIRKPSNGRTSLNVSLFIANLSHLPFFILEIEILLHQFENVIDFTIAGVEKVFSHGFNVMFVLVGLITKSKVLHSVSNIQTFLFSWKQISFDGVHISS
jgi:hypothetical protein